VTAGDLQLITSLHHHLELIIYSCGAVTDDVLRSIPPRARIVEHQHFYGLHNRWTTGESEFGESGTAFRDDIPHIWKDSAPHMDAWDPRCNVI
jgi:hypothetical protein